MAPSSPPDPRLRIRGRGSYLALIALAFVVLVLIFFPAMRIFVGISALIGVACAAILHFWNRRPIRLKDEQNKRPLGLS